MADFEGLNVVDMSLAAIDARLRRASQLRRLCLSLADAGRRAELASGEEERLREATTAYETPAEDEERSSER